VAFRILRSPAGGDLPTIVVAERIASWFDSTPRLATTRR
jgi:hypothetical protein